MDAQILVVESDDGIRNAVASHLQRAGHLVATASSASQAMDVVNAATLPLRLVILDPVLPEAGAVQLLEALFDGMSPSLVFITTRSDASEQLPRDGEAAATDVLLRCDGQQIALADLAASGYGRADWWSSGCSVAGTLPSPIQPTPHRA